MSRVFSVNFLRFPVEIQLKEKWIQTMREQRANCFLSRFTFVCVISISLWITTNIVFLLIFLCVVVLLCCTVCRSKMQHTMYVKMSLAHNWCMALHVCLCTLRFYASFYRIACVLWPSAFIHWLEMLVLSLKFLAGHFILTFVRLIHISVCINFKHNRFQLLKFGNLVDSNDVSLSLKINQYSKS